VADRLTTFFERLEAAQAAVLFLDYDGTLAPFTTERERAVPYRGVRERLGDLPRTRLVVVSGRPVASVLELLDVRPAPEVWGEHGLERRYPDGRSERAPLPEGAVDDLATAERWARAHLPEDHVERKIGTVALHVRGVPKNEAEAILRAARDALAPLARPPLRLSEFDGGLELRTTTVDKGRAVRTVLCEAPRGAAAAYLGDDLTDEDAFAALDDEDPGHLPVLVRQEWRPTRADVHLRPPEELLGFLDRWREARRAAP
jgi:trehalose-phosphatase